MNKQPQTYEEWLLDGRQPSALGQQICITYALLQDSHREYFDSMFNGVRNSFQRVLFDTGYKSEKIIVQAEEDVVRRGKTISTRIDAYQGCQLEDFAPVVYQQSKHFYNEVKIWEDKSLWQYLIYWAKRTYQKVHLLSKVIP